MEAGVDLCHRHFHHHHSGMQRALVLRLLQRSRARSRLAARWTSSALFAFREMSVMEIKGGCTSDELSDLEGQRFSFCVCFGARPP